MVFQRDIRLDGRNGVDESRHAAVLQSRDPKIEGVDKSCGFIYYMFLRHRGGFGFERTRHGTRAEISSET